MEKRTGIVPVVLLGVAVAMLLVGCSAAKSEAPKPTVNYAVQVTANAETTTMAKNVQDGEVLFTVTNTGLKADTYTLTAKAFDLNVTDPGFTSTLSLEPGASQQVAVPIAVPDIGGVTGMTLTFTHTGVDLTAVSQGDPKVVVTGTCGVDFE